MRFLTLLITTLLCGSVSAAAVDFKDLDLDPLLRVRVEFKVPESPIPAGDTFVEADLFVTRGGATTIVRVIRFFQIGGPPQTIHQLIRGGGSSTELADLKQALSTARAGVQASCVVAANDSPPDVYEVTWYGRSARRNSFTVVVGQPGTNGLGPCPELVSDLVDAIVQYQLFVLNDPASEVLTNE